MMKLIVFLIISWSSLSYANKIDFHCKTHADCMVKQIDCVPCNLGEFKAVNIKYNPTCNKKEMKGTPCAETLVGNYPTDSEAVCLDTQCVSISRKDVLKKVFSKKIVENNKKTIKLHLKCPKSVEGYKLAGVDGEAISIHTHQKAWGANSELRCHYVLYDKSQNEKDHFKIRVLFQNLGMARSNYCFKENRVFKKVIFFNDLNYAIQARVAFDSILRNEISSLVINQIFSNIRKHSLAIKCK